MSMDFVDLVDETDTYVVVCETCREIGNDDEMVSATISVHIVPSREELLATARSRAQVFRDRAEDIDEFDDYSETDRNYWNDRANETIAAITEGTQEAIDLRLQGLGILQFREIELLVHADHMYECSMCSEPYLPPDATGYPTQWNATRVFNERIAYYWDYYEHVCITCADSARACDRCGEVADADDMNYIDDADCWACDECLPVLIVRCEYCGTDVHRNYHDFDYCRDENYEEIIHNYSYRPYPEFHTAPSEVVKSSTPFMGFELEVEVPRERSIADAAEYAVDRFGTLAYLKHDGSLDNGFEIVTHPHTLRAYAETFPFAVLDKLSSEYGVLSWRTSTCGLHVHISRSAFGGLTHQALFIHLIQDNEAQMQRLAGREGTHWAKFGGEEDWRGRPITVAKKVRPEGAVDRYQAVNTTNTSTLEVRIFRGSMMPRRVLSALELVDAAFHYTQFKGANALTSGALTFDKFAAWLQGQERYSNLNYYIKLYGLYGFHTVNN